MVKLVEAVPKCHHDRIDLLEYAGFTTLPLVREIQRVGVSMRLLVKHPDTLVGIQRERTIATLDTIYNSIFESASSTFEIRCYRMPSTLRARKLGRVVLELGWLTPDPKRQTAYGHANPSVIADLSTSDNDYLSSFFERTFEDYWGSGDTEDGRVVLTRLGTGE